jgi:ATP-GRASP peptide maturase of grasp-with-spasm system
MIYIISSDTDISTTDVIEWLNRYNKKFLRINNIIELKNKLYLEVNNNNKLHNTFGIDSTHPEIDSIWFRKTNQYEFIKNLELKEYYKDESKRLINFIFSPKNKYKIIIGTSFTKDINKLNLLALAEKFGLNIPNTIVANNKEQLLSFIKVNNKVLTKPISEIFITELTGKPMAAYTKLIAKVFSRSLPEVFPVTLFQQYINKEFEIRTFYLKKKIYSMAIFSQTSKKTKIDFRNYDYEKPNRCVPYKLPHEIEEKLKAFMISMKFDASSVDMVKCNDTGKYYFLEVNPYGQFGMVSSLCNYYLEKKIAFAL